MRGRGPARVLALVAVALAPRLAAPADAPAPVRFGGEVRRGEAFERVIAPGVVFRLVPDDEGWTVWIGPPDHRADEPDWSAVVTPPFHGPNARDLQGWHFRHADDPGANAPGPGNVNAPGAVRDFAFVTAAPAHRAALDALRRLLWPVSDRDREDARQVFDALEATAARGRLVVREVVAGNPGPGRRPWIERLRFDVELFRAHEGG